MKKKRLTSCKIFILSFLFIFFLIPHLSANQIVKEYLFLLDTSGSMIGQVDGIDIFDKVKEAMYEKIDKIPINNAYQTHVVLMTFDEGIQSDWSTILKAKPDKEKVKNEIEKLRATGDVTWITHGLDGALEKLNQIKTESPSQTHWQYLYMFTDAINTGPGLPPKSFDSIIKKHNLSPAEYHRNLYIITLGVPDSVTQKLRNTFKGTGTKVDSTIKGQEPIIPTTFYFDTTNKNVLINETIHLVVKSNDIIIGNLDTNELPVRITYPNKDIQKISLNKSGNSFTYNFNNTKNPGIYNFNIVELEKENLNINSEKSLTVNVYPIKVSWEKIEKIDEGAKEEIEFTIKSTYLMSDLRTNFSIFSKNPQKLQIKYKGKKAEQIPISLSPNKNKQAVSSLNITFHVLESIGWPGGVKFSGSVGENYQFKGSISSKIPLIFWFVLILILLLLLYITCIVLNNKVLDKWQISFENVTTSLSAYTNFFSKSIVVGKDCFVDYFKSPCFKIYGNCLKTPFNKNIYIKAYKDININGEQINPGEKKELYKETTINYENKTIVLKTDF